MSSPDPGFNPYLPPASALEGGPETLDPAARVPWEDPERYPRFWSRLGEMFAMAFKAPTELMARVPSGDSLGAPWRFILVMAVPGLVLLGLFFLVMGAILFPALMKDLKGPGAPPPWLFAALVPLGFLIMPIIYFVQMLLWGLVNHACLWLWGGLKQGQPLLHTLRATGYGLGFLTLGSFIPLLNYVVLALVPVVLGMGLARMHRTDTWRGVCAALTPLMLCCCIYGGIFFVAMMAGAMQAR